MGGKRDKKGIQVLDRQSYLMCSALIPLKRKSLVPPAIYNSYPSLRDKNMPWMFMICRQFLVQICHVDDINNITASDPEMVNAGRYLVDS